ncbi:hypothetical protein TNCV_1908061 [Trichonephila clavipes]|nr:hypothetical protein TNCV_1908061 [Trichonephila clavipes]
MHQRVQVQSLKGRKIRTWDLNAKPFHLIPAISCEVVGVFKVSDSYFPPLDATGDYFPFPRAFHHVLKSYMKSLVYASPVDSSEVLVTMIDVAASEIREMSGVFTNVRQSLRRQCETCIFAGERSFE